MSAFVKLSFRESHRVAGCVFIERRQKQRSHVRAVPICVYTYWEKKEKKEKVLHHCEYNVTEFKSERRSFTSPSCYTCLKHA